MLENIKYTQQLEKSQLRKLQSTETMRFRRPLTNTVFEGVKLPFQDL